MTPPRTAAADRSTDIARNTVAVLDRMRALGRLGRSSAHERRRSEIPHPRPTPDEPEPPPQIGITRDDPLPDTHAGHPAPTLRVAQLVREREAEARAVERSEQELRVAQLVQQQFLPRELPALPGWTVRALYRPARPVGGDFHDFVPLDDGRLMIVCGDVADRGVPAALVLSGTHALLRDNGPRLVSPGAVLARVNDLLCASVPEHMSVTCLIMVLDPDAGRLTFANAGHNPPYLRGPDGGVRELRATGMPLGLLPGMRYDEVDDVVAPGESMLLHSDGLAEAHAPEGAMFGFERVKELVATSPGGSDLIERCLAELAAFTAGATEQEDDLTLVTIERERRPSEGQRHPDTGDDTLLALHTPGGPGGERGVVDRVGDVALEHGMAWDRVQRLRTAVGETVANAIEHGHRRDPAPAVDVAVYTTEEPGIEVHVSDRGGPFELPGPADGPDLEAKLAGEQTPRGWGLFLVRHMVDAVDTLPAPPDDPDLHTVVLTQALQDPETKPGRTR